MALGGTRPLRSPFHIWNADDALRSFERGSARETCESSSIRIRLEELSPSALDQQRMANMGEQ